eukprot:scaffold98_cov172-Amphora_coffeaeformis.AAC.21
MCGMAWSRIAVFGVAMSYRMHGTGSVLISAMPARDPARSTFGNRLSERGTLGMGFSYYSRYLRKSY